MHKNVSTVRIILSSALKNAVLSIGTVAAVAGAIVTALIPPLVLERIVNTLTEGNARELCSFQHISALF